MASVTGNTLPSTNSFLPGYSVNSGGQLTASGGAMPAAQQALTNKVSTPTTPSYSGGSIVDYLNSQGKASDYNTRAGLAQQYGITGYSGSADQNTQLLNLLRSGSTTPASGSTSTNSFLPGYSVNSSGNLVQSSTPASTPAPQQGLVSNGLASSAVNNTPPPITTPVATSGNALYTTGTPPPITTPATTPSNTPTPGLVNPLNLGANAAYAPAATGLYNIGTQGSQAYNDAVQHLADLKTQLAKQTNNVETAGTDLNLQTGQEAALNRLAASEIQAAQEAVTQQQTQQGQQITALSNTGNLLSPGNTNVNASPGSVITNTANGQQYSAPTQVSPGNYLANPQNGEALGGGQAAGIQAATNWAIAQQNMQQGRDYQGQAQAISNALQTLAPVQQAIVPYMAANNLDAGGTPFANQQINKIDQQNNAAAYATMEAAISEARSYAIQLLGSQSGANPTDVTNSVNSFDFNNFTPTQLNTFLNNLAVLGQYRLAQAQSASQAGYGANGQIGTPAQGMTADTSGALQSGGATSLQNLPTPVKTILGGVTNITSDVLKSLGNVISGAAGGAAESFLSGGAVPTAASVLGI